MLRIISFLELRSFLLTIVLVGLSFPGLTQVRKCKLSIDASVTMITGHGNAAGILPGDTICLQPGQKSFLLISYLHGSKNNPIVIQNTNGLVFINNASNYGVKFDSCSYLKFSGAGFSPLKYGIKVDRTVGAGLSVDGLSTDVEIENVEIINTGLAGIFAKTDPNCQFNSTREKFTLRNLIIHDNYIRITGMEGMYLGSSKYMGQSIPCGGKDTTVLPHLLKGVKVYRNIVEESGWDAIQVSSADSGCTIYDNVIIRDSKLAVSFQMSGILIGGGTNAKVFNNQIKDGFGDGIDVISMGSQYIYNNLILNPGSAYKPDSNFSPWLKHGIYVGKDYSAQSNSYLIIFNTIISPKSDGVKFTDNKSTKNFVADNIIVDPGSFPVEGENAYINLGSSSTDVTVLNNLTTLDINSVKFINPVQENYDLKSNSPAVNHGVPVSAMELHTDFLSRIRPFAKYYDIGAFECQDSSLLDTPENETGADLQLKVLPNPSSGRFNVEYQLFHPSDITISLLDNQGRILMRRNWNSQQPGKYQFVYDGDSMKPGFYSLIFKSNSLFISKKLIILTN